MVQRSRQLLHHLSRNSYSTYPKIGKKYDSNDLSAQTLTRSNRKAVQSSPSRRKDRRITDWLIRGWDRHRFRKISNPCRRESIRSASKRRPTTAPGMESRETWPPTLRAPIAEANLYQPLLAPSCLLGSGGIKQVGNSSSNIFRSRWNSENRRETHQDFRPFDVTRALSERA